MSHEVLMPRLSQDMESGQVVEWLKAEGDTVARGEPILIVETDKANMDVEAPASGILRRIVARVGADAAVGGLLAVIADEDEELVEEPAVEAPAVGAQPQPSASHPPAPADASTPGDPRQAERRPSSPAARRVAAQLGVDLATVHGSGEDGLITEADVRTAAVSVAPPSGDQPAGGEITEVPLVGLRRRGAERLALSRRTVADVTTVIDVDMAAVAEHRLGSHHPYTAYVAWATARALADHRSLNASFADDRILLRRDIDLGVAVALDDGLVVPVVRGADRLTLDDMAAHIERQAEAARRGALAPEQLRGSTFTLTNSGTYGSLFFTPIVNLPEVAILGMGRVAEVPVVRDGAVVPGKVMYLCLTYDHRAVEGADAVRFLADVKRRLETVGESEV